MDASAVSTTNISILYNISGGYIGRLFKKYSGVSFIEYLINYRVKVAKQIMKENKGIKIKDVALKVGYTNSASFIRCFKNVTGVSPINYRDSLK